MLNSLRRTIRERGQGLTEYVLILAFIAGVAFMMFGGNGSLKGTVADTLTETVRILADLFGEGDGYVAASKKYPGYFKDWSTLSSEELNEISAAERLKADQEGLALIASYFLGKTQDEVHKLMAGDGSTPGFSNTYNNAALWISTNLDATRMGPGEDGWSQIMVPLSYWNTDFDANGYYWLECSSNVNLINAMAGEENSSIVRAGKENFSVDNTTQNRSATHNRLFYSDGMIGADSANRAVAVQVHYNGDTVDQVRVSAQTGVLQQNKKIENKYNMSPGNSALNGQSTPVPGLDLTVTGSSSDYKYKVN